MNVENDSLSESQISKFTNVIEKYSDIFSTGPSDMGRTSIIKHQIVTDSQPIRQGCRRVPLHKQNEIKTHVQDMLDHGVIQPSCSPWAAPVVLVPKKDGSTRFCIDYRKLNTVTKKDAYPLPRIDQTMDALANAKLFSSIDLISGYWQIELDPSDKEKSAFTTSCGLYEFNVMPFGLCGAPSTFQRLMETVLAGLQWEICLVYLDDVIIFSDTFEEHLLRLEGVFTRIREAGLKLKPNKCQFLKPKIHCLGHVISQQGVEPDERKVKAVKDWPTPMNSVELQQFLGFATYYRRFVNRFADIAAPLYKLTQKQVPYRWNQVCEDAFLTLKHHLTSAPILAFPRTDCQFLIDTDASEYAIGAVLSQVQEGTERVVAYASRSLTKAERNYCTTRRELLALVFFIKQFRHYLYGSKFVARTDHKALQWLFSIKEPEGQIARWITQLSEFDFQIKHREGKKHQNADGMSRIPCRQCGDNTCYDGDLSVVSGITVGEHAESRDRTKMSDRPVDRGTAGGSPPVSMPCQTKEHGNKVLEISSLQRQDPVLQEVIGWVKKKERPSLRDIEEMSPQVKDLWSKYEQLTIKDDTLYLLWANKNGETVQPKLILPKELVRDVMYELHDSPTGGHLGIAKTYSKVMDRFYWFEMRRDVENYVRNCHICESRKNPVKTQRAPLHPHSSGAPFEKIAVDILEVPMSDKGNKYIIVIGDYFTKWVEVFPLKSHTAVVVAEILVDRFITRFGAPFQIHSDQGPEFESKLVSEVCKLLGVDKTRTTSYHPQSDGQVERFNRTLLSMLSKYVHENQKDWDLHLQKVVMAYRTSKHQTTQYTPAYLLFGRELRLPVDVMYKLPENEEIPDKFVADMRDRFHRIYEMVRKNIGDTQKTMSDYYNRKVQGHPFEEGERVWYFDPRVKKGRSTKLNKPWKGPFVVKKRISDLVYRIQMEGSRYRKVVHFNKLKKYKCDGEILRRPARTTVFQQDKISEPRNTTVKRARGTDAQEDYFLDYDDSDQGVDQLPRWRHHEMFPLSPPPTPEIRRDNLVQEQNEHLDNNVPQVVIGEDEEKQQTTEGDSDQGTRRSTRNRRLPVHFKDFVVEIDHETE